MYKSYCKIIVAVVHFFADLLVDFWPTVRVIWDKSIAFVRYKLRAAAEFAKEAMADQSLGYHEVSGHFFVVFVVLLKGMLVARHTQTMCVFETHDRCSM